MLYHVLYTRARKTSSIRNININAFRTQFNSTKSIAANKRNDNKSHSLTDDDLANGCHLGLDSHADMTCIGKHARILEVYHGKVCNVFPFNDSYEPIKNVHTVNAAFAYDTDDGHTYIIEINQCLDFSDTMEHSLLCTNQARMNGIVIDDCPVALDPTGHSTHSIYFPNEDVRLPLLSKFPISFLPVRYPSTIELDTCMTLSLTSTDDWDTSLFNDIDIGIHSLSQYKHTVEDFSTLLQKRVYIDAIHHENHNDIRPSDLASLWGIGLAVAQRTLGATTHDYMRKLQGKISRRVKTAAHQRQYKQLGGYLGKFCSDTFKSNVKSTRGNTYIQLFSNRANYVSCYPLKAKSSAHNALDRFLHDVGIPTELLTDGAGELNQKEWGKTCRKHKIRQFTTEPHTPRQNPAELAGGNIKRKVRQLMKSTSTPVRLWDYCWVYAAEIRSLVATDNIYLDGDTPFSKVHGYTPDISEYLTFKWYDWVWYHEPNDPDKTLIGRWLGPAHDIGQGLAYYVLTEKGKVVIRSTVSPITDDEFNSSPIKEQLSHFTTSMESFIGNFSRSTQDNYDNCSDDPYRNIFEDDDLDDEHIEPQERDSSGNVIQRPEIDSIDFDAPYMEQGDKYIGTKIPLPHPEGELMQATVKQRKRNHDGTLRGTANDNPILDTREYEVEFADGSYAEYAANTLTENLYDHIDNNGNSHSLLSCIIDHECDTNIALPKTDSTYTYNNTSKYRITTKGWKIKVEWKDGSCSWIPMKIVKESNPIELAEYAIARNIHSEAAFAWWVPHTIKKRNRIIKLVKHRTVKHNMKFGVKVPQNVSQAREYDKENGNTLWEDSINKELKNVIVAFKLLDDGIRPPPGSKKIPYHFIFTVRFDLTRKSRLVAGGHRHKDVPSYETYSSVVSRDSVRIMLTIAALNNLNLLAADIGNAYLNAPNKERVHITCGPELFGPDAEGRTAIIVRALYGLKTAGNAWRHHFSTFIRNELGYQSTKADDDVYRKARVRADGTTYYSYIIVYVDDILCCDVDPLPTMQRINEGFRLKNNTIEVPKLYLGTDVRQWTYTNEKGCDAKCWALGSESYLKEAIRVCEKLMTTHDLVFTSTKRHGRKTPFSTHDYRPELDDTLYCNGELTTVYQNLIGILRWICELGRMDILHEVSILSQYLAQPRIGHLQQSLNIFYYLKHHNRSYVSLDPTRFDIDWKPRVYGEASPNERALAMKDLYPDAEETFPHDMPEPRGEEVDINVFVDADHAGNRITRRSHTGIILMVNMSPVLWYSKRQNTVETSTFGSEIVALRIAIELIDSLRYKLRMFGVPLSGPARVFCDNESVVKTTTIPESRLKKKHCSIGYHRIRESVAAGAVLIYYETSETNLADLFTKPLSASRREPLVQGLLS